MAQPLTSLPNTCKRKWVLIISSASSNSEFAQIYWTKYLQPRRQAFAVVLERAEARKEIYKDLDPRLVFDVMSGIMLYALNLSTYN